MMLKREESNSHCTKHLSGVGRCYSMGMFQDHVFCGLLVFMQEVTFSSCAKNEQLFF